MNKKYIIEKENLKKYTTFKIGGTAKYFAMPNTEEELLECMNIIKENNLKYFVIGNGSNILLDDTYFSGMIISLKNMNNIIINENTCEVESGVLLPVLVNKLIEKKYTNFDWASHIPGAIGGSIYGNAGAHQKTIFDDLVSIKILEDDEIKTVSKKDIKYSYRSTDLEDKIIISATFNIYQGDMEASLENIEKWKNFRIENQPYDKKGAGSTFKNPEVNLSAGKLIEDAGLKGYKIGGAVVSEKHANFIINEDNASFEDVTKLINYVIKIVKEKFDITLETEVKIIKWDNL